MSAQPCQLLPEILQPPQVECTDIHFLMASSSSDAASYQSSEDNWKPPDYVRMLLFNDDHTAVLMFRDEDRWDLPYFIYPQSLNYRVHLCCTDLENELSISAPPSVNIFTVMAELYGEVEYNGSNGEEDGFSRLMLIECHCQQLRLPSFAAWKDSTFISSLLEEESLLRDSRSSMEDVLRYMTGTRPFVSAYADQRYHYGWYESAVTWFLSEVSKADEDCSESRVEQVQVIATSTVMRLETRRGGYYLKAPALGLKEVAITAKIASLFPSSSPTITATSSKLNCFISEKFHNVEFDGSQDGEMVKKLALFQLESLNCIEELKEAGCDVRSPVRMARVLQEWAEDRFMEQTFDNLFSKYKNYVPKLVELVMRLEDFNLPLTLVHGDFSGGNAAFKTRESENLILFDWQYACIAHPFLDLHEVTVQNDFPEDVVDDYLELWSNYEPRERAREAFKIARTVGWILKIWTSYDCLKQCNPQKLSSFNEIVIDAFKVMVEQIDNPS